MSKSVTFAAENFPLENKKGRARTGFLILIKSGTANVKAGKAEFLLEAKGGVYIPQNKNYEINFSCGCEYVSVFFSDEKLKKPFTFTLGADEELLKIACYAARLFACGNEVSEEKKASLYALILSAIEKCGEKRSEVVTEIEKTLLARFKEVDFELSAYLNSLPFSPDYLRKLFQKETGETPLAFLTRLRLSYAKALLETGNFTVKEASVAAGIKDPLYFSRCFKQSYGASPKK